LFVIFMAEQPFIELEVQARRESSYRLHPGVTNMTSSPTIESVVRMPIRHLRSTELVMRCLILVIFSLQLVTSSSVEYIVCTVQDICIYQCEAMYCIYTYV